MVNSLTFSIVLILFLWKGHKSNTCKMKSGFMFPSGAAWATSNKCFAECLHLQVFHFYFFFFKYTALTQSFQVPSRQETRRKKKSYKALDFKLDLFRGSFPYWLCAKKKIWDMGALLRKTAGMEEGVRIEEILMASKQVFLLLHQKKKGSPRLGSSFFYIVWLIILEGRAGLAQDPLATSVKCQMLPLQCASLCASYFLNLKCPGEWHIQDSMEGKHALSSTFLLLFHPLFFSQSRDRRLRNRSEGKRANKTGYSLWSDALRDHLNWLHRWAFPQVIY